MFGKSILRGTDFDSLIFLRRHFWIDFGAVGSGEFWGYSGYWLWASYWAMNVQ